MSVVQLFNLPFLHLAVTLLLFLHAPPVHPSCQCGYLVNTTTTNSTTTTTPTLFTTILETDFLHLTTLTDAPSWLPQNYTVPARLARGPYGKNASLANITPNPLLSQSDFTGPGTIDPSNPAGLQLYVRSSPTTTPPTGSLLSMSELATTRTDILYGSFRAAIKITGLNGTCSAFFLYHNDTQEIDLELLSRQQQPSSSSSSRAHIANLVLQSPSSLSAGYNAANTPSFLPFPLPFDPTASFHEYRYDWLPHAVSFYADGALLATFTDPTAIPSAPGGIHFSHWSNGDPAWSGGPPAGDAVMMVAWFKGYFNTSADGAGERGAPAAAGCGGGGVCAVPDVVGGGDEGGLESNASMSGAWFEDGGDGKGGDGVGGKSGVKGEAESGRRGLLGRGLEMVAVMLAWRVILEVLLNVN